MALYQTSVLKNYLNRQDEVIVNKAYKKYVKYFHNSTIQENIKKSKEEEYQGIFLTELFVNILGYTLNPMPHFNLVAEKKNQSNAQKADGAILKDNLVVAVIELKGTKTKDLESIRKQAFDYKANQKGCVFVITSNYEKLRFYINDATEFEEFNLFTLTNKEFELLYLCLNKENILGNLPLKIKEESVTEEEKITKSFYADYSMFKRELYRDLVKQNGKDLKLIRHSELGSESHISDEKELQQLEKNAKLTLFKKSQKLIDRFLFIFFAEDRDLLPPNSTIQILDKWKSDMEFGDERPLYNLFKQYFNYLDSGRKKVGKRAEIYAYNGGLFKPDVVLDSVKINDELLFNHTKALAKYDFESQVDVNILGHIFENSLNEIESVNAEIEGSDFDKQKSKRKKDGVFYTPKYITKYIVENTIGKLCIEKKEELGFKEEEYYKSRKGRQQATLENLIAILDSYRAWLLKLTICDPACGSGAFLNQALDFLIKEHRYIDELKAQLLGGGLVFSDIENTILENNIYGVDLNEESVEIAKLSLWLRTAQPKRKLNDLSSNIKCGNSLIDSKAVARDKAFNWQQEFPQIFKEKNKKAFHITTAVHDSRTSERMIEYKVREKRDLGTNPTPNIRYFTEEDEFVITQTIANIVKDDNLKVLAYNICADHIHLLLVCEEEKITKIVQKIKSITSKNCTQTREHALLPTREHALLPTREHAPLPNIKKQTPLWTQKFGCKEITTEGHLFTAIDYIKHNRSKHNLPQHSKVLKLLIENFVCDYKHAFREEYKGGFDVIIGNPPYGAYFNNLEKEFISIKYFSYQYKFESYLYFYELGLKILNENGLLSFITPELFLRLEKSENIRKHLIENSKVIEIKFCGENVFQEVKVNTVILTLKNTHCDNYSFVIKSETNLINEFSYERWKNSKNKILEYEISEKFDFIIRKIIQKSTYLDKLGECVQGLTAYDSYRGHSQEIIKSRAFHFNEKVDDFCGKWLDGKSLNRYSLAEGNQWLKYGDWLAAPREPKFFENPRILFREIPGQNKKIQASYTDKLYYYGHSITPFILTKIQDFNILYILSIINSGLLSWYASVKCSNFSKKTFPKLNPKDIKDLPIPDVSIDVQKPFIEKAEKMLSLNKELQEVSQKFQRALEREFALDSLPKKLQDWYLLSYGEFIKELEKKKVKFSLSHKAEWEDYFLQESNKVLALKTDIDTTDKEIDAMVYELYGLSEEEIIIVENS